MVNVIHRQIDLDIIKILAILSVILFHVPYVFSINVNSVDISYVWIVNVVFAAIGVPLFVMTTGTLALGRKFTCIRDVMMFYKNNLLPIYFTGVIWCFVYYFINESSISFYKVIRIILLIDKPEVHLWYLRMIILYYLFMPLICFMHANHKNCYICVIIVCFFISVGGSAYLIIEGCEMPTFRGWSILCYLVYMSVGHWISQNYNVFLHKYGFVIAIFAMAILILLRMNGVLCFIWYDNPLVFISSTCMFCFMRRRFDSFALSDKIIELSKMTFGVYLSHMVWVKILASYNLSASNPIIYYVVLMLIAVLSFAIVYFSKKIPLLSKILFRY